VKANIEMLNSIVRVCFGSAAASAEAAALVKGVLLP
jgi:hypothetical protein